MCSCIELEEDSRERLRQLCSRIFEGGLPQGWRQHCEHMTICVGPLQNPLTEDSRSVAEDVRSQTRRLNEGEQLTLQVVSRGYNKDVLAVGVIGCISCNRSPHVTVATGPRVDAAASNAIRGWQPLKPADQLQLHGRVCQRRPAADLTQPYADALAERQQPCKHDHSSSVLVCARSSEKYIELDLGEGVISHREFAKSLPDTPTIQAILEPRRLMTLGGAAYSWLVYTKQQVFQHRDDRSGSNLLIPVGMFPDPPHWRLPPNSRHWGGSRSDVWSAALELPVAEPLRAHAALTNDRPIPRYQMIVDPNQFVREGKDGHVWVPCEFDVGAGASARIVGGDRCHKFPELASRVATPVLEAALPLLAKLSRPRLLLDQRRIQVVFKAQRIVVPPAGGPGADSEYVGLWHVDGRLEHVAAVALYYYHVDPALEGGDMDFCGREPFDVLGWGDCSNNGSQFTAASLKSALGAAGDARDVQRCRVPVRQGTLLVFSNYQMVHRVLRMVNRGGEAEASRDFVALFVLDPAARPLMPARCFLAESYLFQRTLLGSKLFRASSVHAISELLGLSPSQNQSLEKRAQLLREQLRPTGEFAGGGHVYSTGNGCYTMIGWLDSLLRGEPRGECPGYTHLRGLNLPPEQLGRGMSEVFSQSEGTVRGRLLAAGHAEVP